MKRFCIVGSGPSGIYTAKYLLKKYVGSIIDVYEKLPTPYGLIRYGVAPDHEDVKSVENDFENVLSSKSVNYFGNVDIGSQIDINSLQNLYSSIFLCYGANADRKLSLLPSKNEKTHNNSNILSAREFVYWYNSHPLYTHITPNLTNTENVVIIGQGNVAIDCARILTKSTDDLGKTDISQKALDLLNSSKVKNVNIIGRRGPIQAAFTIKEFRELTKLENCFVNIRKLNFENGVNLTSKEVLNTSRPKKRIFELMEKYINNTDSINKKKLEFNFLMAPKNSKINENGEVILTSFIPQQFINNSEYVENDENKELVTFNSEMVIKSVGFVGENLNLDFLNFDEKSKKIKHNGIGHINENIYTSGWIKRGAIGIVGTNIVCAKQTLMSMDENEKDLKNSNYSTEDIILFLKNKNINFVDYKGWKKIDKFEKENGKKVGKPREKIETIEKMLKIAL